MSVVTSSSRNALVSIITWILDSRASHYLTLNFHHVPNAFSYQGDKGIAIGYGNKLPIDNARYIVLHASDNCYLFVNNLFHTLYAHTTLLSI